MFVSMCVIMSKFERQVCLGLRDELSEIMYSVFTKSLMNNNEMCGMMIGDACMKPESKYPWHDKWKLSILDLKDDIKEKLDGKYWAFQNLTETCAFPAIDTPTETLNNVSSILQISDIHLDPEYEYGSPNFCQEPVCCRPTSMSSKKSKKSGVWGSFGNCDTTMKTLNSLIDTVTNEFKDQYRYILFSGDYVPHDIWKTTKKQIISVTRALNNMFRASMPKDKIVIPVVGNHEGQPINQFVSLLTLMFS